MPGPSWLLPQILTKPHKALPMTLRWYAHPPGVEGLSRPPVGQRDPRRDREGKRSPLACPPGGRPRAADGTARWGGDPDLLGACGRGPKRPMFDPWVLRDGGGGGDGHAQAPAPPRGPE